MENNSSLRNTQEIRGNYRVSAMVEDKQESRTPVRQYRERRNYTDEEKAQALATLDANNGRLLMTAEELGIPLTTLYCWDIGRGVSPDVVKLRKVKKEELAEDYDHIAKLGAKLGLERIEEAKFRDLMVGNGIAVDIAARLRGEPTQVIEHRQQVKSAYVYLIERNKREPQEAIEILSEELQLPVEEVKRLCE
jgi:hypothetical protein